MPLTLTARRSLAARQIRTGLAEAYAELAGLAGDQSDRRAALEALIAALHERLGKRREVVLAARQASLLRGVFRRRTRARGPVVWGFPAGYDPNVVGDRCEICRHIDWQSRAVDPDYFAWSCRYCAVLPAGIPV